MKQEIISFIEQNIDKFRKFSINGTEVRTYPPFPGFEDHDTMSLSINLDSGKWKCHRSDFSGKNLKQLEFKMGAVPLREPAESLSVSVVQLNRMHHALLQDKEAMDYLLTSRCLPLEIIKKARLGLRVSQFSSGVDMYDGKAIVFPSFDKRGVCIAIEEHFFQKPKPNKKTMSGSNPALYAVNPVDFTQPLIITEGRYDALSLMAYGYENVGSVPNGSKNVDKWAESLSSGVEFYLCFDMDAAGNEGVEKLASILGKPKCHRVYPPMHDISECLQYGVPAEVIDQRINEAEPLFIPKDTSLGAYVEEAMRLSESPEKPKGDTTGWNSVDRYLGGVRLGEITILTGETGHGKSTWGKALIQNLRQIHQEKYKFLLIMGEESPAEILLELATNYFRKRPTKEELIKYQRYNSEAFELINAYQWCGKGGKQLGVDVLFDNIDYYIERKKTNYIFIDHARLFINEDKEREEIASFLNRCRQTVVTKNVHICIVVQPSKLPPDQRRVTSNNLKGSVNWKQDAWNIITIHRDDEESHTVDIGIEKNRALGTLGHATLRFDTKTNMNYYEIL